MWLDVDVDEVISVRGLLSAPFILNPKMKKRKESVDGRDGIILVRFHLLLPITGNEQRALGAQTDNFLL